MREVARWFTFYKTVAPCDEDGRLLLAPDTATHAEFERDGYCYGVGRWLFFRFTSPPRPISVRTRWRTLAAVAKDPSDAR